MIPKYYSLTLRFCWVFSWPSPHVPVFNGGNKEFRKEFEYEFTVPNVHIGCTEFLHTGISALFNNMRTLKFKAQPTYAIFATANQKFGGSTQLPTTAERDNQIKSSSTVQTT